MDKFTLYERVDRSVHERARNCPDSADRAGGLEQPSNGEPVGVVLSDYTEHGPLSQRELR